MRYLTKIVTLLCFCLPLSLMAQSSVVGDWLMTVPTEDGQTATIKLSIAKGNTFTVDFGNDGSIEVNGTYNVSGDQMSVKSVSGPAVKCTDEGIYKYEVKDGTFTMTRVSDPCEDRGGPEGIMVFKGA